MENHENDKLWTFYLTLKRAETTLIDITLEAEDVPEQIAKARKTVLRLLNEYSRTPELPVKAAKPEPEPEPEPELEPELEPKPEPKQVSELKAGNFLGTSGLLHLHCADCGSTFTTYLREEKTQFRCKCGGKIDLTAPMAAYQFDCPYCGKHGFGTTNIQDATFTVRCTCGCNIDLYWNKRRKRYVN